MKKLLLIPAFVLMTSSGAFAFDGYSLPSTSVKAHDFSNKLTLHQDVDVKWSKGTDVSQVAGIDQANIAQAKPCACNGKPTSISVKAWDFKNKAYVDQSIDVKHSKYTTVEQAAIITQTNFAGTP